MTKPSDLSHLLLREIGLSGRNPTLVIRGNSMLPMLRDGQRVTVDCSPARKVRKGEIILFQKAETLVVHRVLSVRSGKRGLSYIEKGDNQVACGFVDHEEVVGVVTEIDGREDGVTPTGVNRVRQVLFATYSYFISIAYKVAMSAYKPFFRDGPYPGLQLIHKILLASSRVLFLLLYRFPGTKETRRKDD